MSIYSGFPKRVQETNYNKLIYQIMYLMQKKISSNNKGCKVLFQCLNFLVPFDEHKFHKIFVKLYNKLFVMESQKHLPPKFSYSLKELATDYGCFERVDVCSLISGSSAISALTQNSGFGANFNSTSPDPAMSMPLGPITEKQESPTTRKNNKRGVSNPFKN